MLVKVAICFWTGVPYQSLKPYIAMETIQLLYTCQRWRRPVKTLMWNFDTAHKLQYHPEVIIDTLKQSKQKDDTITREDALRMENLDLVLRTTQVRSIHYACVMVRSMWSLLQCYLTSEFRRNSALSSFHYPPTSSEIFFIADRNWRKLSDKSLSSCKQTEVSMPWLD